MIAYRNVTNDYGQRKKYQFKKYNTKYVSDLENIPFMNW